MSYFKVTKYTKHNLWTPDTYHPAEFPPNIVVVILAAFDLEKVWQQTAVVLL